MFDRARLHSLIAGLFTITAVAAGGGCTSSDGGDDGGGDDGSNSEQPVCGNGVCESGEPGACTQDCPSAPVCGDNVCAASEASACLADCGATLTVENASTKPVWYLYVAACGAAAWGDDQLGANVIAVGSTFRLRGIPPGCWGFKAVSDPTDNWQWVTPTGVTLTATEVYTWQLL